MSEPADGPGAPLLGRHGTAPAGGYPRLIGAHRAGGSRGPNRGYLFTVALLAGTASMPILAAISAGSGTVGRTALPDTSTPFIPTPSVGPVVIQTTGQPALTRARPAPTLPWSATDDAQGTGDSAMAAAPLRPAAPGPALALRPRSSPTAPATVAAAPSVSAAPAWLPSRSPSPLPNPSPTCSPSATRPLPLPSESVPLPTPRPTVARTPSAGGPPPAPPYGPAAPVAPRVPAPADAADAAAPVGIPVPITAPRPWAVEP